MLEEIGSDIIIIQPKEGDHTIKDFHTVPIRSGKDMCTSFMEGPNVLKEVVKEQESIHKSEALGVVVAAEEKGEAEGTIRYMKLIRIRSKNGWRIF